MEILKQRLPDRSGTAILKQARNHSVGLPTYETNQKRWIKMIQIKKHRTASNPIL
ncbi:MAG: hypothetical protein ACI8ZB_005225 [Desulforhopalus sp.]|jgi:hypothetical protein